MLTKQIGDRHPGLNLIQDANDLLFGVTLLHS
jgi:hypothetical protein